MPALTGDVTSSVGTVATTVGKIQGTAVSATAPTTNQVLQYNGTSWVPTTLAASGTVTSVGLSLGGIFTSRSPITTTGTLTGPLATQTANFVVAAPTARLAAAPTFRALVAAADLRLSNKRQPLTTTIGSSLTRSAH